MTDNAPTRHVPSIAAPLGSAVPTGRTTFVPSFEDLVAAYRLDHRGRVLEPRALLGIVAVLLAVAGLSFAASDHIVVPIVAVVAVLASPFATERWVIPSRARRIYDQQQMLHEEYVVEWDADGLRATTRNSDSRTPWTHYRRWRENEAVILVYHSDAMFQFVPKRALDADQIASLRSQAVAAGVPSASAA